jgi:hypothetical protein
VRQVRWVEWYAPELHGTGPFGIGMAIILGLYWEGFTYDHEGD